MRSGAASARVKKPLYTVRSLKMQQKAREKALKLRAAVAKLQLKLTKLEHRAAAIREKILRYEDRANRMDDETVVARPASRTPPAPPKDQERPRFRS